MRTPITATLVLALTACLQPKSDYQCTDASACINGGTQGTCEPTGYCSFTDPGCPAGRRYGEYASPDLANLCVGSGPPGTCTAGTMTFTGDGTFTLPADCTSMTVAAYGGGGAGAARHNASTSNPGGTGGLATKRFTGQTALTAYTVKVGRGGTCESGVATAGGYAGGGGGGVGTVGAKGAGASSPPGGAGGPNGSGTIAGGPGGKGGYGGGGGGGGGDTKLGNSGGGASTFQLASTDYVVAGGGGGAGATDQDGDVAGVGGAACNGNVGMAGTAGVGRGGGGGGGGVCFCLSGTCDAAPSSGGGAGGAAGGGSCTADQNGEPGKVVVTYP